MAWFSVWLCGRMFRMRGRVDCDRNARFWNYGKAILSCQSLLVNFHKTGFSLRESTDVSICRNVQHDVSFTELRKLTKTGVLNSPFNSPSSPPTPTAGCCRHNRRRVLVRVVRETGFLSCIFCAQFRIICHSCLYSVGWHLSLFNQTSAVPL